MSKAGIHKQRDIIDRKALLKQFDDLAAWSGITSRNRNEVLDLFKEAMAVGTQEIQRRFEEDAVNGADTVRAQAFLVDQVVRVLYDVAVTYAYPVANPTTGEQVSIVATGGYGRGELAPQSDIDLMFLLNYKRTPRVEQVIEYMLYMLWDLKLKVGHATRSVDEAVKLSHDDLTIRTSLLESRLIWGDEELYQRFRDHFNADIASDGGLSFVDAKLAERDARHERMGDTRYVLEPNVKEGKGGLRDLQTLMWIAKYLYRVDNIRALIGLGVLTKSDARRYTKAENFLWTVRCNLHYLAGRAEERLTFNVQDALAKRMAYTDRAGARGVERFMKHYFLTVKDVGDLTRVLCAVLEAEQKKPRFRIPSLSFLKQSIEGFAVEGERLKTVSDDDFRNDPVKLIRLFAEAQRHRLDIHPHALRLVSQNLKLVNAVLRENKEANALFIDILTSDKDPAQTLMRMNEAGVLGRFIPDFGRVVAQMQYDMYHVYTVDEHTIRAIGILSRIEAGLLKDDHPAASEVIREVQSRRVMYIAVFLHDIAKGRGGDHSVLGSKVAEKLCPRFGFTEWETETVAWLVRHHLLMSNAAFKRDIEDSKTILDFIKEVQSPERLRLLLVLTVADIRAVGPDVWNGWKATLLRELYYRAQEAMSGGMPEERHAQRVAGAKARLADALEGWTEQEIDDHIAKGYNDYWLGYETQTHVYHANLIRKAEQEGTDVLIEARIDDAHDITEVTIYTHGHPGVFARIAGAMSLSGAAIVDAKVTTMTNGMALDTFWIQDAVGGAFTKEEGLKRIRERIEGALRGKIHPARELTRAREGALPSRTRVFTVPPRVLIDNNASNKYTVIEVNGRDRLGFLNDIASTLNDIGLQVTSAHIATYGERVVDVFYVKDVFGLKIEHGEKLKQIKAALLDAIQAPELKGNKGAAAE